MSEKEYYMLTAQGGESLREHDFVKSSDGTYLFTEDEARRELDSSAEGIYRPVAVHKYIMERMFERWQQEKSSLMKKVLTDKF